MRIPLYAHDANPYVDKHLCYKSRTQVINLLLTGQVYVVRDFNGRESGVQFISLSAAEHTLPTQMKKYMTCRTLHGKKYQETFKSSTIQSNVSISENECKVNVGLLGSTNTILRVREKVAAYPHIYDTKAVTAHGSWACLHP